MYRPYPTANSSKSSEIKKFAEQKNANIKKFVEDKSASIAISSAFNGAAQLANTILELNPKKDGIEHFSSKELIDYFWVIHEGIYKEYLERFAEAQIDGVAIYNSIKGRRLEIADKELSAEDIEVGNDNG